MRIEIKRTIDKTHAQAQSPSRVSEIGGGRERGSEIEGDSMCVCVWGCWDSSESESCPRISCDTSCEAPFVRLVKIVNK